ncbi:CDP-glycerol glycerophosphotransferase family protein [Lederbergia graminis]|uniref:CDP-glycerol glycerophosphotransferase family protein n=1 Tax=Lederbergia graminis TaxID=735518 RepID=A0ABW0LIF4_9BACI
MKKIIKSIGFTVYRLLYRIVGLLTTKDDKMVMFESFLGKQYSDNPRAIYEYMLEHYPEYKLYWSFDSRKEKELENTSIQSVRRFSFQWMLLMNKAKYWVTNSRLPYWIPKSKGVVYLQTWHGTPLKRLAADMNEVHMAKTNTEEYKKGFLKEAKKWDYLVSPNAYSTEIFKRAFQFNGTMLETGYPRNDFLFTSNDEESIKEIKQSVNLPLDKKIILYAPTWRDNQYHDLGKYKFDLQMDLQKMKDELGEDYIILLRLHYLVAENLDIKEFQGFVYDFSNHKDIRELYVIADLLITDYSSVFFDYGNLRRPMIFFVYDLEEYRDQIRGFYYDFEAKAPGPLVRTTEEIIRVIQDIDENGFSPSASIEAFYEKFCYLEDGNATKRVVDAVFKQ